MSEVQERWKQLAQPRLVSVRVLDGVTIKTGWFRREQLFVYRYEDGRAVVGYPVHSSRDAFVVQDVPWLTK